MCSTEQTKPTLPYNLAQYAHINIFGAYFGSLNFEKFYIKIIVINILDWRMARRGAKKRQFLGGGVCCSAAEKCFDNIYLVKFLVNFFLGGGGGIKLYFLGWN